ncbi:MAG TPA: hypothetical protein VGO68_03990 [Pyrinomonadaceae bacterium]|jgi:hypothetical protein|nr:hypothetical protein [Pyrinomonadaceae bacterium]
MKSNDNNWSRAALVVAHPSHELRVHGWMQTTRPLVFVLTDGSGRTGEPRMEATSKVLTDLGAQSGSIYGRFTDREIYDAFLKGDFQLFIELAKQLADAFSRHRIQFVVADAAEGYSPTHDACRLLTDAAVEIVRRKHKRQIANFDVAVVGPPDECPEQNREQAIWLHLDDEAFARKFATARSYSPDLARDVDAALRGEPFKGVKRFFAPQLAGAVDTELSSEVVNALHAYPRIEAAVKGVFDGVELSRFRTECLRPVNAFAASRASESEVRYYEVYGEQMVAAGHYSQTLRYAEHLLPLEQAVWSYVESYREVPDELLVDEFSEPATAVAP